MPDRLALALLAGLLATGTTVLGDDVPRTFTFVCLDDATGKPIPGATIRAYLDYEYRFLTTDADGSAAVPRPEKLYDYTVDWWKEGYVQERRTWSDIDAKRKPLPERFESRMKAGVGRIGGRIVDEAGRPVAGATLRLYESPPYRKIWKGMIGNLPVVTDADGRWSTTSVPPETCPISGWVKHPEFREKRLGAPLADFFAGKADIVLKRGSIAEGVVRDLTTGEPIAGAKVMVGDRNYGRDLPRTVTGPDGKFRLANLEPGETNLIVMAEGRQPQVKSFSATLKATTLEFRLEPGRRFHGRVVDLDGMPAAGAWVSLLRWQQTGNLEWRTRTDDRGRFAWSGAPTDEFEVNVHKPGFASDESKVKADDAEQILVLTPSVLVRGEVKDARTGEKIAHFQVDSSTPQRRRGLDEFYEGDFWFDAPRSPKPFTLTFRAEGYRPYTTPEIDNREPFATRGAKLQPLDPGEGGGPTGRVVGLDGKPTTGAFVLLVGRFDMGLLIDGSTREPEGRPRYTLSRRDLAVGEGGTFTFHPVNGAFRLAATHSSGFALATSEDLAKSDEMHLKPWARVEGRVDDSITLKPGDWLEAGSMRLPGEPIQGNIGAYYREVKIGPDRRFVIERVLPAEYRIEVHRIEDGTSKGTGMVGQVTTTSGETAKVSIGERAK